MRALVIGYGSIGARHARLLCELGAQTAVLSRRAIDFPTLFTDLPTALATHRPDYVVIATATAEHRRMLDELSATGFSGAVLVEKPLFDRHQEPRPFGFSRLAVAYNLRYHPALQRLKELVAKERILTVCAYMGQYLPDWRPATDYRQSYSASLAAGGGALRDLSHELDYVAWLFGRPLSVTAVGGHLSSLEIDSDDAYALLMRGERCPLLSVQVSYLDRVARRRLVVNTENHVIEVDLIRGVVAVDKDEYAVPCERDYTYREMHGALMRGDWSSACTYDEALATMGLIAAAERANETGTWVKL